MAEPMFSKTGSADFPQHLKCMISGPPKSGKTVLTGTVPNIVIADTEPHANNLQSVAHLNLAFKTVRGTDDLRQLQFVLNEPTMRQQAAQALGLPAIEAVSIDTIDTLQAIMKQERMRQQHTTQFLRDDWGWLKEEMVSILQSFLELPMHVFFVVHTKTKDVGTEKNPRVIYLPGVEGSLAESIAGMVGYSLLCFRKEEIRPDGKGTYTKYWLRAEGDETYEYLGNRAAGRLPDVIEPDFKTLLDAAMAGRPTQEGAKVPEIAGMISTTDQIPQAPAQQPAAQQPPAQQPAQQSAPPPATPPAPAQPAAPAQNQGQEPTGVPAQQPADSEPVNAAALTFVKRVYDSIGQPFPEDKIRALNLGRARDLVRTFKAIQQDAAEGNGPQGTTPIAIMTEYLQGQDLLADPNAVAEAQEKPVVPKVDGNIAQVKAYATDLTKVQEAYDLEVVKDTARSSLIEWLVSQGARPVQSDVPVQTDVQTPAPVSEPSSPAPAAVTPPAAPADPSSEEQAVQVAQEGLGAQVIEQGINPDAKCEECHNTIDDVDLAQLGWSRFHKVLCVTDYIAETKKPKASAN